MQPLSHRAAPTVYPIVLARLLAAIGIVALAVSGGLPGAPISTAQAQSFNCNYARLPAEIAICQDIELRQLDSIMASHYYNLPGYAKTHERGEQKRWLARRNRCGYNAPCLRNEYVYRIGQLQQY